MAPSNLVVGHTKVVQAKRNAYGSVSDLRSWKMVKSELSSDLTMQCSGQRRDRARFFIGR